MSFDLKSAGVDQVLRALKAGGTLDAMPTSFYSGGHTYTHVLSTKRGRQYRVSAWVVKACLVDSIKSQTTDVNNESSA